MARPALSASRTTAVLDLLAAFPGRAFTMSEIVRATHINFASCHAVLNALAKRGYLMRLPNEKTYVLGPALVAIGQATLRTHPLIERAQAAAEELARDLAVPVLLTSAIGDEILVLASIAGGGRNPGMRMGQRMPLVPPAGAHFLAWRPEAEIEAWIAKAEPPGAEEAEELRRALALVRSRGFQVTLQTPVEAEFAALMAGMAAGRQPLEYKEQAGSMISAHSWRLAQPDTIQANETYEAVVIAAPLFDRDGGAPLSLCLTNFGEKLSGAQINAHAEHLLRTCLSVMREDRAA